MIQVGRRVRFPWCGLKGRSWQAEEGKADAFQPKRQSQVDFVTGNMRGEDGRVDRRACARSATRGIVNDDKGLPEKLMTVTIADFLRFISD